MKRESWLRRLRSSADIHGQGRESDRDDCCNSSVANKTADAAVGRVCSTVREWKIKLAGAFIDIFDKGEYVRHYTIHANGIESVWALLKRRTESTTGLVASISSAKLTRRRGGTIAAARSRVAEFLGRVDGRLTYNVLIGKA
jgi:hypothetical protein